MRRAFEAIGTYFRESDIFLLVVCILSSIYGLILIYSATRVYGTNSQVVVQTAAIVIGVVLYIIVSLIDIDIIADKHKLLFVLGVLFICTLFIWGVEGDTGNKAWLRFFGVGIQPAEVVKILFIIILARMISTKRDSRSLNSAGSIFSIAGVFAVYFALILLSSRDLGSALVYVFVLAIMLFVGGVSFRWILLGVAVIAAAVPVAWYLVLSEKQQNRIAVIFNPSIDPTGLNELWQSNQSKLAISSGGFTGQGLFHGKMTQSELIPQQHTDFIFSAAGEELGFIGCMVIVLLLVIIVSRCLYVGVKSNNALGLLVCSGVAASFIFQTLENIGMCLGITPVIGLTLPFFSYGGSSMITSFIMMGLISGVKMRPKPTHFRNL